jgi:hypothetical protein
MPRVRAQQNADEQGPPPPLELRTVVLRQSAYVGDIQYPTGARLTMDSTEAKALVDSGSADAA